MSGKHIVAQLDEPDLSQSLQAFLTAINTHPELAEVRAMVPPGPTRQLALFAALERAVLVGSPASAPPALDDQPDQLLCDILDAIDTDPNVKNHGSAYGPDRHLANLQAFGVWRGEKSIGQPSARELFTTQFSALSADSQTALPPSHTNYSPASQVFSPNGDLIHSPAATAESSARTLAASETVDTLVVLTVNPNPQGDSNQPNHRGIIHHSAPTPGDQSVGWAVPTTVSTSEAIPTRPIRRGPTIKLDDLAKGRVLGLMSHGLSFRQAAAQLGVHHTTLLKALKRDEQFAQQVSEARLDAISQPLLTVIQASRTNWRAAAWLAKFLNDRRASGYETTPEEHELARLRKTNP